MKLHAMHNYVLIRIDETRETKLTAMGLVLPEEQKVTATGEIVSIGPDARVRELTVGKRVLFPPFGIGEQFTLEGTTYMAILDHQLLGAIR